MNGGGSSSCSGGGGGGAKRPSAPASAGCGADAPPPADRGGGDGEGGAKRRRLDCAGAGGGAGAVEHGAGGLAPKTRRDVPIFPSGAPPAAAAAAASSSSSLSASAAAPITTNSAPPPPPPPPGHAAALLDSIPGMVFTYQIHPDGTSAFTYVSSYSRRLLGLSPGQIVSSPPPGGTTAAGQGDDSSGGSSGGGGGGPEAVFGRIVPEDRPGFHQRLMECLREGKPWEWTGRIVRRGRTVAGNGRAPDVAHNTDAASTGGTGTGEEEARDVRTVKFTSSCPPVRRQALDLSNSSAAEQQQCITVFNGIVLDVTPPTPPTPHPHPTLTPAPAPAPAPAQAPAPVPAPTSTPINRPMQDKVVPVAASAAASGASSDPTALVTSAPAASFSSSSSATSANNSSRGLSAAAVTALRSVLDSAPHPVIALDAKGTVTEWNRTAEILTGYAKAEAVGRNFASEFVVGACRKDVNRMLEDVSHLAERQMAAAEAAAAAAAAASMGVGTNGAAGALVRKRPTMAPDMAGAASAAPTEADPSCEATLQTKPGQPAVHLLLTASPQRMVPSPASAAATAGPKNGAVIIAQDMSKQHAALALHRSETEKGIMEWLSHEVRNPLSVAVEASRTLKEDPSDDPEENSNNLELICLSLGYIVELLTDMLDLNKCAEGKITISPTVCRLREDIILPTKRMLDARRKSVDLIIDGGEEIWAYVDRLRLQQVLTNLIVNSMKYTSIGFIRVGIRRISREEIGGAHLVCATGTDKASLENKDATPAALPTMNNLFGSGGIDSPVVVAASPSDQNDYYGEEGGVLISVSDSGSGIEPSNYHNLFERWEKLGSKTNGTGIGLCLCRSLMEVMGGRIFLSKTYNSGIPGNPGCQFCIVLPPAALDGSAAAADYQSRGGGSSEDVPICTAALSKRLSRDKNKPESVLKTSSSYDKLASSSLSQSSSLQGNAGTPGTSDLWQGSGGMETMPAQYSVENGDAGRDAKKVSFAPQLDDAQPYAPPHAAQNPHKPVTSNIGNGADVLAPVTDNGAAASGSVQNSTFSECVSNAGAASHGTNMGRNSMIVASSSAATTAASSHHHHQAPADDPFHNTCLSGKFRLLVVDDDETFRIMFVRRLKRMFPKGIVDESPSGEDSIEKAKKNVYDLVTMDHFMALDELNGADTIRALRSNHCDACIVGISGNTKTVHHLEAGADDFIRKPVPTDRRFIRRLVSKMSPPAVWKVLIADDCKLNLKFMHRKLIKVASPHYTTKQESDKRWQFTLKANGEDCVDCLKEEWFDLCVLDQHMGPGLKGTDVASFIRKGAVNPSAIVVINTGVEKNLQEQGNWDDNTVPFNFQWTKPAPAILKIRQDLCLELVAEKTSSGTNFGESLTKAALLKASVINEEAGLIREREDDGTSSVISEGSVADFDSNTSGKEETQLPEHQKVLQKLYDEIGDELAFSDMCTLFVTTVPAQLDTIDQSLDGHDWNNLSLILHKLKGTLQVFHIDACVALVKPLYEQSLVLKTRGQKRKQGEDAPGDDVSTKEFEQMRQSCSQLRVDIVSVIKVCQGVVDNGTGGGTETTED